MIECMYQIKAQMPQAVIAFFNLFHKNVTYFLISDLVYFNFLFEWWGFCWSNDLSSNVYEIYKHLLHTRHFVLKTMIGIETWLHGRRVRGGGGGVRGFTPLHPLGFLYCFFLACLSERLVMNTLGGYPYPVSGNLTQPFLRNKIMSEPPPPPLAQWPVPGLAQHHGMHKTPPLKKKNPAYATFCTDYSLNKKEWICSLFKEWILEKSEIRVNLEWKFLLFTNFGVTTGITRNPWAIPVVTPIIYEWITQMLIHSKFTLISLFSKIHSLKSEHIHSFFV